MNDRNVHHVYGVRTPIVDLLRRVHPDATAEITEPDGWKFCTNIGRQMHMAADEIERLQKEVKELRSK